MSAVVVGYIPTPAGRAALELGVTEARLRQVRLVVVNTTRGDALVDERFIQGRAAEALRAELEALDLAVELRQPDSGGDVAEELDRIATEVDASVVVIGLRHRTQVGKLILGSAASRILLTLTRPVLTVRP